MAQKTKEKTKDEHAPLLVEVLDKINTLAATAFGLVAALAWNDTIKGIFKIYFPQPQDSLIAQIAYTLTVTILVVIITILLAKSLRKAKKLLPIKKTTEKIN